MPTPTIPTGFKPIIQGFSIGSPDGVNMSPVGGGLPRVARSWERGVQPFQVSFILESQKYSVWEAFFHHKIKKGSIQFSMPLDSGFGLSPHLCLIVPGSYNAGRAGGQVWSVTFTVLAEAEPSAMSDEDADNLIDLWEGYGDGLDDLVSRLAEFSNEDLLVLGTP